jgi:hypothetical protein
MQFRFMALTVLLMSAVNASASDGKIELHVNKFSNEIFGVIRDENPDGDVAKELYTYILSQTKNELTFSSQPTLRAVEAERLTCYVEDGKYDCLFKMRYVNIKGIPTAVMERHTNSGWRPSLRDPRLGSLFQSYVGRIAMTPIENDGRHIVISGISADKVYDWLEIQSEPSLPKKAEGLSCSKDRDVASCQIFLRVVSEITPSGFVRTITVDGNSPESAPPGQGGVSN